LQARRLVCKLRHGLGRLSPFVEKVVRAVTLKGLPHTLVDVKSPLDFKRWNPQTGKMPVLDVDGERIYDSTLILRALDSRVPEPPLVDVDPHVAAHQRFSRIGRTKRSTGTVWRSAGRT
jgi:glutathione S-transferase